jgi:ACS family tartrate transporter-like MFS transporter
VLLGVVVPFILPDRPHHASWLTPAEADWLEGVLQAERLDAPAAGHSTLGQALRAALGQARQAIQQPVVLLLALGIFATNTGGYALVFWLPAAVKQLLIAASQDPAGQTAFAWLPDAVYRLLPAPGTEVTDSTVLNWLSVAYAFGLAGVVLSGWSSDRTRGWKWHCVAGQVLTGMFLAAAVTTGQSWVFVFAWLCLVQFFAFFWPSPFWVLPTLTMSASAAAVAIGFINMCANLAGQVGPAVFGEMKSAGFGDQACLLVLAGCYAAGGVVVACLRVPQAAPAADNRMNETGVRR